MQKISYAIKINYLCKSYQSLKFTNTHVDILLEIYRKVRGIMRFISDYIALDELN